MRIEQVYVASCDEVISFRMRKLWRCTNKNIYINRECTYYCLNYYRNNILFLKARLVLDDKMFGKVTTFAKHLHEEIISCYELAGKASGVCQTALWISLRLDQQFMTGKRKLSSAEQRLKTATAVTVAAERKRGQVEISDQRRPMNDAN